MKKRKLTIAVLMMLATASNMNAQSVNPNENAEQIIQQFYKSIL